MEGESSVLTLVLILAGGAGVLILSAIATHMSRLYRSRKQAIHCETKGKDVDVEFVERVANGVVTGVRSCTAFSDPNHVTCGRDCVNLVKVNPPSGASDANVSLATKPR